MNSPLLNPDNRLLSWSIGDLGLYGAALTPATVAAAEDARQDRVAAEQGGASGSAGAPDLVASSESPPATPLPTETASMIGEGSFSSAAFDLLPSSSVPLPSFSAPVMRNGADAEPGVPNPVGSGSVATPLPLAPAPYVAHGDVSSGTSPDLATFASPTLTGVAGLAEGALSVPAVTAQTLDATGAALAATVAGVALTAAQAVEAAADDLTPVVGTLETTVDATAGALSDSGDALTGAVSHTLSGVGDVADAGTSSVTGAVSALADTATPAVSTTTQAVADTVGTTTQVVDATVAPVVAAATSGVNDTVVPAVGEAAEVVDAAVTPAVAGVVETLADGAGAVQNDVLGDVGGADPAAGVATLVDMVASADEFDLSHVVTTPLSGAGSIADVLAADPADAPLLGDFDLGHDPADDDAGVLGL